MSELKVNTNTGNNRVSMVLYGDFGRHPPATGNITYSQRILPL